MDEQTPAAVICERSSEAGPKVQQFLTAAGLDNARWYAPRDADEVDRAVRDGRIRRVIFSDLSGLLDAMWDEEITVSGWLARAVRIDFADAPSLTGTAVAAAVEQSWSAWRACHRRRQIVGGLILGSTAVISAFLLILLR